MQRFRVVPLALAFGAGHKHIGQKVHLDFLGALPLAVFAAAAFDIKAEASGFVSADLCLSRHRKQRPDQIEHAGISRRIGPRRAADGRLVDLDDLVDPGGADDILMLAGLFTGAVEFAFEALEQDFCHQRTLARTGHPRHTGQHPQREPDGDIFEIIGRGASDLDAVGYFHFPAAARQLNPPGPAHILPRN